MIELNLDEVRKPLQSFLEIGRHWLFAPKYVCTTTKEKNIFGRFLMPGLEPEEQVDPMMDMGELDSVLKNTQILAVKILVKSGTLIVREPYEMELKIPRIVEEGVAKKLHNLSSILDGIVQAEDVYQDPHGGRHKIARFEAPRDEFLGFLDAAGSPDDSMTMETGSPITLTSDKKKRKVRYSKVAADAEVSIHLSMLGQTHLRRTLVGAGDKDKSKVRVTIADKFMAVFQSPQLSVLAGALVEIKK
jgi:hypothetical protein